MYNPGIHDQSGQLLARGIEKSAAIDAAGMQQLAQGAQVGVEGVAKGVANWVTAQQESEGNKTLWEGIKQYYPGVIADKQDQKFYNSGLSGQRAMITQANAFADMMLKQQNAEPRTWAPDPNTIAAMQGQGYAWAPTSRAAGQWMNAAGDKQRSDRPHLVQQADQTYGLVDLQSGQMMPVIGPDGNVVKGMPKSANPYDMTASAAQDNALRAQKLQGEIAGLQQTIAGGKNNPWYSPGGIFGSYEAQLAQKQAELQQLQGGVAPAPPVAPMPAAPQMPAQARADLKNKLDNLKAGDLVSHRGKLHRADGQGGFSPVE
jgi:hypothetical protein